MNNYKIIVAYDNQKGIGIDLEIPWYISDDLKRFKKLTIENNVIMGSNTFKNIISRLGKPLQDRKNIILSRTIKDVHYENCFVFNSFEDLIKNIDTGWIIGGSQIYNLFLPYANEIYATEIDDIYNCNIFFPKISKDEWSIKEVEQKEGYKFVQYKKNIS